MSRAATKPLHCSGLALIMTAEHHRCLNCARKQHLDMIDDHHDLP